MILDPLHYLATLDRKPGALDHAPVFRDWKLPACFAEFRARLERQHGIGPGTRQYARVLQLLAEHPLTRLVHAIDIGLREQLDTAEAVIRRTRTLAAIEAVGCPGSPTPSESSASPSTQVDVPLPDLSQFNQLLSDPRDDNPVHVFFA